MRTTLSYRTPIALPAALPAPAPTTPVASPISDTYVGRRRGSEGSAELWADRTHQVVAGTDVLAAVTSARLMAAGAGSDSANGNGAEAILRAKDGTLFIALLRQAPGTSETPPLPFALDASAAYAPSRHGALVAIVDRSSWVDLTH